MAIGRRRLILLAASTFVAACTDSVGSRPPVPSDARPASPLAANGALGVWPDFITRAPLAVRQAYEYAASDQRILQFMPCYCGCGSLGHTDNLSCFIADFSRGGWVVLDQHGAACGTCVGIALDAKALELQGLPVKEVRRSIDAKWSKVGPGTPTRLP